MNLKMGRGGKAGTWELITKQFLHCLLISCLFWCNEIMTGVDWRGRCYSGTWQHRNRCQAVFCNSQSCEVLRTSEIVLWIVYIDMHIFMNSIIFMNPLK